MTTNAITALTTTGQKNSKISGVVLGVITCSDLHIKSQENVKVLNFLALGVSTASLEAIH